MDSLNYIIELFDSTSFLLIFIATLPPPPSTQPQHLEREVNRKLEILKAIEQEDSEL